MPKGKPPEHSKFKPGISGNPTGRPPGPSRSNIARKWLELNEKALNPITGQTEKLSQEDIITLAMIKRAKEGDTRAYNALMDSAHGKAKQLTDLTGRTTIIDWETDGPKVITGMVIYKDKVEEERHINQKENVKNVN